MFTIRSKAAIKDKNTTSVFGEPAHLVHSVQALRSDVMRSGGGGRVMYPMDAA